MRIEIVIIDNRTSQQDDPEQQTPKVVQQLVDVNVDGMGPEWEALKKDGRVYTFHRYGDPGETAGNLVDKPYPQKGYDWFEGTEEDAKPLSDVDRLEIAVKQVMRKLLLTETHLTTPDK